MRNFKTIPSLTAAALVTTLLAACDAAPTPSGTAAAPVVPTATEPAPLRVDAWPLPAPDGAAQPDLVVAPDGTVLLSWIEPEGEGHALRFARHGTDGWSAPQVIARGDDWFVNWADTPHIVATADGALWAHWLRKSAAATYAYDVVLSRSADGGATWSEPMLVNDDGTPTEHGFASLWAAGPDRIGVAWLDGRATGGGHGEHGGGMMTLRTLQLDGDLARSGETRLDASTCDCCQTDVALAGDTPVLAYRDRTAEEIRDIAVVRLREGQWTSPQMVHPDDWTMPACPVNGPSVAAEGGDVAVAWYTAAGGTPRLRLARSDDGGEAFSPPVELDAGEAVMGRVDIALDDGVAWVSWLREDASGQVLRLARRASDGSAVGPALDVAAVAGRGRGTGFPQLALVDGRAHLVWTDVVDGRPRLRGAVVAASR